jgi:hypothetical protein
MMLWLALLAAAPESAPPAAAPPATAPAAARVSVPFTPPLDRPLRYRSTVSTQRDGQSTSVATDYEITFSRDGEGFRMRVHATGARDQLTGASVPGYLPPYTLLLGENGAVEELEDADAYWDGLLRLAAPALRTMNGGTISSPVRNMADYALREATPEARLNHLTRYIGPILDYAGDDYAVGEERVQVDPVQGLMGVTLNQRLTFRAERIADGRLFMSTRTTLSGDEMREQLIAALERAPENARSREERAAALAEIRSATFDRTVTSRFELSVATGLVVRLDQTDLSRRSTQDRVRVSIQRLTIEQLD